MSRADKVDLRVRAYGHQGVEFALSGPKSDENRGSFIWWLIAVLLFASGGVLSTVEWGVSSRCHLVLGVLLVISAAWVFQASGSVVVEESMLVVPALGVKLSKRRRSGAVSSKFVDLDKICGVAVNEAITFSDVVYSFVLMVRGQSDMVLPFETFRPRIAVLQDIYRESKALLFPNTGDRKMRLPDGVAPHL
ncbi:Phosphatidylinositol N-acetylglucosaminyltransferase subunit H [Phytophthora citrophthora]|uniref:Phosphatidylinositol N-acetylglucosaminyltransferase subunit H n=1 Tax=Phytophthora citrophthora TaxID=4793 RepID=A0AAD9GFT0_9STRA|nr:Phosphatidylinositol N-acetylglucosaminyltransferase subunit H [Phytophthora citrophthora]